MNEKANFNVKVVDFPETLIATIEHRDSPNMLGNTIKKSKKSDKEEIVERTSFLIETIKDGI